MTRYDDAVAAVDGAISTVTTWCDQVRQEAEQRMGVPAGAESVIGDPWYQEALEIRHDLIALRSRLTDPRNGF
ncbi:hypothetical protein [Micromonospora sp. RL09-050-HVF-A]|uniref:hypothetical protein n=1 Tax=Micromonospora sp. RL09-050-HVF-A TaxID=1703433 RepID=UPI001C5F0D99|nr:hypothetical protein [Micromonospora sp. RL09-050-HVF-A]MBW4700353.1 hypothetical protein [Micromonospora sp. RL09-050-HVF-A]